MLTKNEAERFSTIVKDYHNDSYRKLGVNAQRRYPNEELCRFMGRNYFQRDISFEERKNIKILELGCGSCANIWMLAKEGFDVYGCDLSEGGIEVGRKVLNNWGVKANLTVCDMMNTTYECSFFDIVLDIWATCYLTREGYRDLLKEIVRILKHTGVFFSYHPSKGSDIYLRSIPENRIDADTLRSYEDEQSPFSGDLPFRFMSREDVQQLLPEAGLRLDRMETCGRTYSDGSEYFEFLVFEATKE